LKNSDNALQWLNEKLIFSEGNVMKINRNLFTRGLIFTLALLVTGSMGVYGQNRTAAGGSSDKANLVSTTVVINEIYGGAGCGTAGCSTYQNDFIEIRNISAGPVDLTGWSVQYASAAGTTWAVTPLTAVMLPSGARYLVAEAFGANGVSPLPTPDATGTIAMSATSAKVALVNTTVALTGACPVGAQIIDLVGYGTAPPSCFETAAAPAPSTTTSISRAAVFSTDTDNNSVDFTSGAPSPQASTATAANALIQGRVIMGPSGSGVGGVRITLQGPGGAPRTALTNPFGYFTFEEVATGQTYFIGAQSKQYQFTNPTQTVTLQDDLTTLTFQVQP
jgi:hypothetical protein